MRALIRRLAGLGLKVQITELDMSIYANSGEARKNADREVLLDQANKYRALFTMFREEARAGNLDMVMLWGLADDGTWLNNHPVPGRTDAPLFFGKDLRAKPAYWILVDPQRLPVQIKKLDATAVDHQITDVNDPVWNYVSPREIRDVEGNIYGSFKLMWTADRLYALTQVSDASSDPVDGVSIFIEPKNQAQEHRTDAALTATFSRSQAQAPDASGYTLLASVPFEAKLGAKIGFDLRIKDRDVFHSWNDYGHAQETSSLNYSTVTLRALPPVTAAKRGTVTIDGSVDDVWGTVEPVKLTVKTEGSTPEGSQFKVLWDDEYVYVLVEVVDPVLNDQSSAVHEQDSVEIFMDQNNGKTTSYEADDGQYRVNFKNVQSLNGGNSEKFQSSTTVTTNGYLVEAAIPLYAVKPAPDTLLGFDVQINDANDSGVRTGIRNWVSNSNMGYQDTSGFGVLLLGR
jgi:endo-1,4-beta-xylanase